MKFGAKNPLKTIQTFADVICKQHILKSVAQTGFLISSLQGHDKILVLLPKAVIHQMVAYNCM